MPEPAYILENGTQVPYVPVEVKTARDAYAASLRVLFKHVADFHLCIVRTFSSKYGIPEDDILQTIQESEEFKNMKVDPVLDTDKFNMLGYVQIKEDAPAVKKTKTKSKIVKPVGRVATEENLASATNPIVAPEQEQQAPIKPKPIRKKVVQKPDTAVNSVAIDTHAMNVIAANTDGTLLAQIVDTPPKVDPETIKTKIIRKKVIQNPSIAPATTDVAPATNTCDAPRKIIRKNAA